jgi:uncharacterized protein YijF (DUF1287 family)
MSLLAYTWTSTFCGYPLTVQAFAHDAAEARHEALANLEEFFRIQPQRKALSQQINDAVSWARACDLNHAMVLQHRQTEVGLSTPLRPPTDLTEIGVIMNQMTALERKIPGHIFGDDRISSYQFNYYTPGMAIGDNGDISLEEFIKNTEPTCLGPAN